MARLHGRLHAREWHTRICCGLMADRDQPAGWMTQMMNLMVGLLGLGGHLGGWRHKDSWDDQVMNIDHHIEIAQTAERGKIDLLFMADGNAVRQMDKPKLFAA